MNKNNKQKESNLGLKVQRAVFGGEKGGLVVRYAIFRLESQTSLTVTWPAIPNSRSFGIGNQKPETMNPKQ